MRPDGRCPTCLLVQGSLPVATALGPSPLRPESTEAAATRSVTFVLPTRVRIQQRGRETHVLLEPEAREAQLRLRREDGGSEPTEASAPLDALVAKAANRRILSALRSPILLRLQPWASPNGPLPLPPIQAALTEGALVLHIGEPGPPAPIPSAFQDWALRLRPSQLAELAEQGAQPRSMPLPEPTGTHGIDQIELYAAPGNAPDASSLYLAARMSRREGCGWLRLSGVVRVLRDSDSNGASLSRPRGIRLLEAGGVDGSRVPDASTSEVLLQPAADAIRRALEHPLAIGAAGQRLWVSRTSLADGHLILEGRVGSPHRGPRGPRRLGGPPKRLLRPGQAPRLQPPQPGLHPSRRHPGGGPVPGYRRPEAADPVANPQTDGR